MKILVLGGTGAMGAPVVQILADRNNHVVVTTRQNKKSQNKNIQFVQGDAHDLNFVRGLLDKAYDAVIDFMIYTPDEFMTFSKLYMEKSRQYVFLSSARVYADSPEERITEDTPRLLDITKDEQYLATNEYALAKAREENVLTESGFNNFTNIFHFIFYARNFFQLTFITTDTIQYSFLFPIPELESPFSVQKFSQAFFQTFLCFHKNSLFTTIGFNFCIGKFTIIFSVAMYGKFSCRKSLLL